MDTTADILHAWCDVESLCGRLLVLDRGCLVFSGPTHELLGALAVVAVAVTSLRRDRATRG